MNEDRLIRLRKKILLGKKANENKDKERQLKNEPPEEECPGNEELKKGGSRMLPSSQYRDLPSFPK